MKKQSSRKTNTATWFTGSAKKVLFACIGGYAFIKTFLASVKNRIASHPPSRPTPLAFTPPNGVRRSRTSQQLIQTIPASIFSATRWARFRSLVHTDDD